MDDKMDDTVNRRAWRTGGLSQKCEARFGCPPLVDGQRPGHKCQGRWFGMVEAGVTADGTRRRITVSAKTKAEASRRLRNLKAEREREGHRNVRRTTSLAKWSTEWMEAIETKVSPSAYDTDRAATKAIVATIGHVKLADLTPADVRAVAARLRQQGKSTSTALRYHGSLIRMLKAAAIDGYAVPPNVLLAERPTAAVSDRDAVTVDQAVEVLAHLARLPGTNELVRSGGVSRWALAFLQGHRSAETRGLTWPCVDLDAETLTISWQVKALKYRERGNLSAGFRVPDGYEARHLVGAYHLVRPKSTAGWRVQPLVPWAANALRSWRKAAPDNPHGLVWPGRMQGGRTWPRNSASHLEEWHDLQAAVGVGHPDGRPYHVHEIRHGAATLLLALGVPESVRIAIMGHSTVASTRTYEHVDLTQARVALEQVAKRLELTPPEVG